MWTLSVGDKGFIVIWPSEKEPDLYEVFLLSRSGEKARLSPKPILLSWAYGFAEQEAQKLLNGKMEWLSKSAWWCQQQISLAQTNLLNQLGLQAKGLTKGEASILISKTLARRRVGEALRAKQSAGLKRSSSLCYPRQGGIGENQIRARGEGKDIRATHPAKCEV